MKYRRGHLEFWNASRDRSSREWMCTSNVYPVLFLTSAHLTIWKMLGWWISQGMNEMKCYKRENLKMNFSCFEEWAGTLELVRIAGNEGAIRSHYWKWWYVRSHRKYSFLGGQFDECRSRWFYTEDISSNFQSRNIYWMFLLHYERKKHGQKYGKEKSRY